MATTRVEHDSLGAVNVEADKLWGAQTQRSLEHFSIGEDLIPREMIPAYAIVKKAAALVNFKAGRLPAEQKDLIVRVCDEIEGAHTWDVAGRGSGNKVITGMNQPWGESESCTSCGKCVQGCPTGALFRKGSTVAEMQKDRTKLDFLVRAREKKEWTL